MNTIHWRPSASIETLRRRAKILQDIRAFFDTRGYWEAETPIMARYGITDVYLSNMKTYFRGETYFLQTSPEYHMKRLLAAGSGAIFQLARVFRDDELGRWHNPEFTLLEWYQLDINHHQLIEEVDLLLQAVLNTQPLLKMTYQQAFLDICHLDPLHADIAQLRDTLQRFDLHNVLDANESCRDQYLFLLMSHIIEPALGQQPVPVAIYDFPISQAALAQTCGDVALRFEVYYRGVELANGFHELTDPALQRARFQQDIDARHQQHLEHTPPDEYLLQALTHGLPACSGVALGIERLLALAFETTAISGCMAFDVSRA